MDLAGELLRRADRMSSDPLPVGWCEDPAFAGVSSFGGLVSRLRRLDHRSDGAMRALAQLAEAGEPEACLVVTVALLPLLIARCNRRPALVAEAVNELAAHVGDPARDPPGSGVANRLLRRVVWRVRHEHGVHPWQESVADPSAASAVRLDDGGYEAGVVDRLALVQFRRRLAGLPRGEQAWATLLSAAAPVALTSTQRTQLARHRRSVRRLAESSLVA